MDYLLKASAIIMLFYVCYKLLLQRETFFESNRWFLLIGLAVAIIIPTIVITIYIEYTPQTFEGYTIIEGTITQQTETPFDWSQLLFWLYSAGVIFFLCRLFIEFFSLLRLYYSHKRHKKGMFTFIETTHKVAPFSFFNWIVYNPDQFTDDELKLIVKHEEVHAKHFHSIDILLAQMLTILLWFNPLMWWYKKELQQNLEFIADQTAQKQSECKKSYQKLLLKTSIPNHQLVLTNNFYNSLIKKRIIMLHKSKSKKLNAWKYVLIIPAIALFMMSFNTKEVFVEKSLSENKPSTELFDFESNSFKNDDIVITKDFTDADFENLKKELKNKGFESTFKGIKRNDKGEITAITIEISSDTTNTNYRINDDEPIQPITISIDDKNNSISVRNGKMTSTKSYTFTTDDETHKVQATGNDSNVFVLRSAKVIERDEPEEFIFVKTDKKGKKSKDTIHIKKDVMKVVWTDEDGNVIPINATESGKKGYSFIKNSGDKPLIIVDGKVVTAKELDVNTISSVNVLKGEKEIETYGDKGKNGVVIVTTKNDASFSGTNRAYVVQRDKIIDSNKKGPWEIGTEVQITTYDADDGAPVSYSSSIITDKTSDKMLDMHKKHLKSQGVIFNYSKLKRNKEGQIVRIKIELSNGKGKSKVATFTNDDGISLISMGIKGDNLFLTSSD